MTCSGACATTYPRSSYPLRPARPVIWWKSRALRMAVFWPSYLHNRVSSTVRIGTLIPTPSVSVPQMTLSNPRCASCSTNTRYFGSNPAWCKPMPARSQRLISGPYGLLKRKPSSRLRDPAFFLLGAERQTGETLRVLGGLRLREMDDVHRPLALGDETFQGLRERRLRVGEFQRHGTLAGGDGDGGASVEPGEFRLEKRACRRAWPTSGESAPAVSVSSGTCHAPPRSRSE